MPEGDSGAEAARGEANRQNTLERLCATTDDIALQVATLHQVVAALAEAKQDHPLTDVERELVDRCRRHAEGILAEIETVRITFAALTTGRN